MRTTIVLGGLLLAVSLPAQSVVVPGKYATLEGHYRNGWPFGHNNFRYQQMHGDLRQRQLVVTRLSFRQDGNYNWDESAWGTARTTDLEILLADTTYATAGTTFAANYTGTPTVAFKRKNANLPAMNTLPATRPAPWNLVFVLDQPFVFTGQNDFLWEVAIYGNSLNRYLWYGLDGAFSCTNCWAEYRMLGQGCKTATSGSRWMRLYEDVYADGPSNSFQIGFNGYRAPANAAVIVLLGLSNPSLTIQGFCAQQLYTDMSLGSIVISADSSGRFIQTSAIGLPYMPSVTNGLLFAQAIALDVSQPGLPIAGSNGVEIVIPEVVGDQKIQRMFNQTSSTAATGEGPYVSGLILKIN